MTRKQARNLHEGDQVKWNDPDNGICSRLFTILSLRWTGPDTLLITDVSGDESEVFISELT